MVRELRTVLVVVGPLHEPIVMGQRGERTFERQALPAGPTQLQPAAYLRSQQAHHVGKDREAKAGEHLLAESRTADALSAFQHQHFLARAREIRRARETVVPAADDDDVVLIHARFLGGSKNGFFTTVMAARLRRCSTVISISS